MFSKTVFGDKIMATEDVSAVKEACDTWLMAIKNVHQAMNEYNDARDAYRKIIENVTIRRIYFGDIVTHEWKMGNSRRREQFMQEHEEIVDAQLALKEKIDMLQEIKFGY